MMKRVMSGLALALLALSLSAPARAQEAQSAESGDLDRTPPRLSFVDGEVSFMRAGGDDWTPAEVNTPLGAGDELYAGSRANLEIQVGARAFVRAGEDSQLGLSSLEPDYLQLRLVSGHASLDLRSLKTGLTLEIDTPQAAFTVEHAGYYRIEVSDQDTRFTSRRGGRATVTAANGQPSAIASSEQVVLTAQGDQPAELATYAAPELDDWDRWNYTRTDQQLDAVSSRYVPYGVYGVDDLDHYGDWRVVPSYGAVWVPRVAAGWAPYSAGSWVYDPYYGWTWVDAAPWGWAPFHYGRWVSVGGYWGWAPGPLVARPYYAPALVAFFNVPSFAFGVSFGHAGTSWVALGWGEPCIPWWGPSAWRGHAHWMGWGGPHVVNNVVINKTTIVNVNDVKGWSNARHHGAVLGAANGEFGRGRIRTQHFDPAKVAKFQPVRGELDEKPTAASFAPTRDRAIRPPREQAERPVVATREPQRSFGPRAPRERAARTAERPDASHAPSAAQPSPAPESTARPSRPERQRAQPGQAQAPARPADRLVPAQPHGSADALTNRPPFGESPTVRSAPPEPPRYRGPRRPEEAPQVSVPAAPGPTANHQREVPPPRERERAPSSPPRNLPGEPANRVFQRAEPAPERARPEPRPAERPQVQAAPTHGAPQGGGQPRAHPSRVERERESR